MSILGQLTDLSFFAAVVVSWRDAHGRTLRWQELIARHPIILENARGLLLRHYTEERLADPRARAVFLPPDRPLD